jgi:hypothetical protein
MDNIDAFILGALLGCLAGFFFQRAERDTNRTLEHMRGFNEGLALAIHLIKAHRADRKQPDDAAGE